MLLEALLKTKLLFFYPRTRKLSELAMTSLSLAARIILKSNFQVNLKNLMR
jgi:hypothetical protein